MPGTPRMTFGKAGGLNELLYAGAGFLHVRRQVYLTVQHRLNLPMTNERFGSPMIPFFQPLLHPTEDGTWYLAEDYAFCERAAGAGSRSWPTRVSGCGTSAATLTAGRTRAWSASGRGRSRCTWGRSRQKRGSRRAWHFGGRAVVSSCRGKPRCACIGMFKLHAVRLRNGWPLCPPDAGIARRLRPYGYPSAVRGGCFGPRTGHSQCVFAAYRTFRCAWRATVRQQPGLSEASDSVRITWKSVQ